MSDMGFEPWPLIGSNIETFVAFFARQYIFDNSVSWHVQYPLLRKRNFSMEMHISRGKNFDKKYFNLQTLFICRVSHACSLLDMNSRLKPHVRYLQQKKRKEKNNFLLATYSQ